MILAHPSGIIIDEVNYDNGTTFPDESGKSMMLIDPNFDNSIGENWISSTSISSSGDYATPGEPNTSDECQPLGDMNNDGNFNVLDVVILANCVLSEACELNCASDLNGDNNTNVLDIVNLVNCILADNCGE